MLALVLGSVVQRDGEGRLSSGGVKVAGGGVDRVLGVGERVSFALNVHLEGIQLDSQTSARGIDELEGIGLGRHGALKRVSDGGAHVRVQVTRGLARLLWGGRLDHGLAQRLIVRTQLRVRGAVDGHLGADDSQRGAGVRGGFSIRLGNNQVQTLVKAGEDDFVVIIGNRLGRVHGRLAIQLAGQALDERRWCPPHRPADHRSPCTPEY